MADEPITPSPEKPDSPGRQEQVDKIYAAILPGFQQYMPLFRDTMTRASGLLQVAKIIEHAPAISDEDKGWNRTRSDDILRAAVVLIHACFEDFLKTLANSLLPDADATVLKDITLAGERGGAHFHLGQLTKHRDKNVDELIRKSISEHLDRSTFNNMTEVTSLLDRLQLRIDAAKEYYPALEELIKRRHQIVHRADRLPRVTPEEVALADIQAVNVQKWLHAADRFMLTVASHAVALALAKAMRAEGSGG